MTDERLNGFAKKYVSSLQCNDRLTSGMFCEWSELKASLDGFSQDKSEMAELENMLGDIG